MRVDSGVLAFGARIAPSVVFASEGAEAQGPSEITGANTLTDASGETQISRNELATAPSKILDGPNGIKYKDVNDTLEIFIPEIETNYLTDTEINDLYSRISLVRRDLKALEDQQKKEKQKLAPEAYQCRKLEILDPLKPGKGRPKYLEHPLISQYLVDTGIDDGKAVWEIFGKTLPNFFIGTVKDPYYPSKEQPQTKNVEFFACKRHSIPKKLKNNYKSQSRPLEIDSVLCTKAMTDINKVALFTEHTNSSQSDDPEAPALYLVNRFLDRYHRSTSIAIAKHAESIFPLMTKSQQNHESDFLTAYSMWLSIHEYNHAQGPIPWIFRHNQTNTEVNYKNAKWGHLLKNSLLGGTFEELRADLNVIAKTYDPNFIEHCDRGEEAEYLREAVLSERLIGYPARLNQKDNFDARSSHMLLNYLLKAGAVGIDEKNVLSITNDETFKKAIQSFLGEVNKIESQINTLDLNEEPNREKAKKIIGGFVRYWACHHTDHIIEKDPPLKPADYEKYFLKDKEHYEVHSFYKAVRETVEASKPRGKYSRETFYLKGHDDIEVSDSNPKEANPDFASRLSKAKNIKIHLYDPTNKDLKQLISLVDKDNNPKNKEQLDYEFWQLVINEKDSFKDLMYEYPLLNSVANESRMSDFMFSKQKQEHDALLYWVLADKEGTLDRIDLKLYKDKIIEFLKNQYASNYKKYLEESPGNIEKNSEEFISRVRRILRARIKALQTDDHADDLRRRGALKVAKLKSTYLNEPGKRKTFLFRTITGLGIASFMAALAIEKAPTKPPSQPNPPGIQSPTDNIVSPTKPPKTTQQILAQPPEPEPEMSPEEKLNLNFLAETLKTREDEKPRLNFALGPNVNKAEITDEKILNLWKRIIRTIKEMPEEKQPKYTFDDKLKVQFNVQQNPTNLTIVEFLSKPKVLTITTTSAALKEAEDLNRVEFYIR